MMAADPRNVCEQLERWRAQGADRVDPVAFSHLAALARRAQRHDGLVARQLRQRVQQLADGYARTLAAAAAAVPPASAAAGISPLRTLLAHIAQADAGTPAAAATPVTAATMATDTALSLAAPPAVAAQATLDEFQQLWGRIRIDSLLRQSQEAISEDAGPLHSSVLLHRAMKLMGDICPAYLQHFLAYSDALSWLEQLQDGGNAAGTEPGSNSTRKSTPRRRRSPAAAAGKPAG